MPRVWVRGLMAVVRSTIVAAMVASAGCGEIGLPGQVRLVYGYEKGESRVTEVEMALKLDFGKLILPSTPPTDGEEGDGATLVPEEIESMIREGKVRSASLETRVRNHQMVAAVNEEEGYADLYTRNEVQDFLFSVNDVPTSVGVIEAVIRGTSGEGEVVMRNRDGSFRDLPRILGMAIPATEDPYIGRLLEYIRDAPAYPLEPMSVGSSWNNNLSLSVPVGEMSEGQAKGYIKVNVDKTYTLERVYKGIAHIKMDLAASIKWDVEVQGQGRSRLNLELTGEGYRMFDLNEEWEREMFVDGDLKVELDAATENGTGKMSTTQVQAEGTFEFASKLI